MASVRKTDETPPRYAIPDVIEMVKGPVNLSQELNRLRERYPEVFEKELDRLRELYEGGVPNWYPTLTVRFRDNTGRLSKNATPVATIVVQQGCRKGSYRACKGAQARPRAPMTLRSGQGPLTERSVHGRIPT